MYLKSNYLSSGDAFGYKILAPDTGTTGHDLTFNGRVGRTGPFVEAMRIKILVIFP
jgi:hypothetical protein